MAAIALLVLGSTAAGVAFGLVIAGGDGGIPGLPASWNRLAIQDWGKSKYATGGTYYHHLLERNAAGHHPGWTFFNVLGLVTAALIPACVIWSSLRHEED